MSANITLDVNCSMSILHTFGMLKTLNAFRRKPWEGDVKGHRMFELAQALTVAKSRQDVPAALKLLHPDMLLESGLRNEGARPRRE